MQLDLLLSLVATAGAFSWQGPISSDDELNFLDTLQSLNLSAHNSPFNEQNYSAPDIQTPHEKALTLLKNMTIEEKVNWTTGVGMTTPGMRCSGQTGEITRLDLPGLCLQDGPAGVRGVDGTSGFVSQLTLGATWDRDLVRRHYEAMAQEFKDKGVHVMLGPVTGGPMGRSAFGGRLFENYAADPVLTGELSYVAIKAIQSRGVQASSKHFLGYEQETYRNAFAFSTMKFSESYAKFPHGTQLPINSIISDRATHELYMWGFAEAVRAGTASVMCSYNRVNGTHACENSYTLNHLLKEELGFQGYVVSDWGGTYSTEKAITSGLDMDMPGAETSTVAGALWGATLVNAVKNGSIPESRLDDAVLRILTPYYALGQDEGYPSVSYSMNDRNTTVNGTTINEHIDVQRDHAGVILEAGIGGATLLKNTGGLPLPSNLTRVAVVGQDSGPSAYGPNAPAAGGQFPANSPNNGTVACGGGSGSNWNSYLVTPLEAITARMTEQNGTVLFNLEEKPTNDSLNWALAAVDTAVVFAGFKSSEGYDESSLMLKDNALIERVASQIPNTIVVIHSTNPVVLPWADHPNITAIVSAFLPGQESGNSLVPILFGDVSPSGKLPFTIAKKETDYINVTSDAVIDPRDVFDDELLLDYRRFDAKNITPQYEFGFGLSYTNFTYSDISVNCNRTGNATYDAVNKLTASNGTTGLYDPVCSVSFKVQNSGEVPGREVAQVYVSYPKSAGEPPQVLRGFDKTEELQPNSTQTLTIPISKKSLSIWDGEWRIPSGDFEIRVGASSRDTRLRKSVHF